MTTMVPEQPADLRSVLERAQEIESETGLLLKQNPEWVDMIHAAEEAGVPREAILEALRERIGVVTAQKVFEPGEIVFATTGNGWFNTARIESVKGEMARVRFLGGGEAEVDLANVKRFNVAPGDKVFVNYMGSWSKVEVITFNRDSLSIQVNYWGFPESRSLDGVRLKDERSAKPKTDVWLGIMYLAMSFMAGAGLSAVIIKILSRGAG